MSVVKAQNIFSNEEISELINIIEYNINAHYSMYNGKIEYIEKESGSGNDDILGRYQIGLGHNLGESLDNIIKNLAEEVTGKRLAIDHCLYVEYSNKSGQPNLPPHFDGDTNELVIDFQLTANTSWNLGVDTEEYPLEDNSALIFNANEHPHWRPNKVFLDGEFVKMLFWRLYDPKNRIDYSHIKLSKNDPIFDNIEKIRGGTNGIQ